MQSLNFNSDTIISFVLQHGLRFICTILIYIIGKWAAALASMPRALGRLATL